MCGCKKSEQHAKSRKKRLQKTGFSAQMAGIPLGVV
jgi:hypothetical protein